MNGAILEKNILLKIKCVFLFPLQLLSETFLILRRIDRDMIKTIYWSSCKEVAYQGGGGGLKPPPPQNSEGPPQLSN